MCVCVCVVVSEVIGFLFIYLLIITSLMVMVKEFIVPSSLVVVLAVVMMGENFGHKYVTTVALLSVVLHHKLPFK